jgi:hypothetical protein
MYGKHYASMYEGSMRGKGSAYFAVWGYVISHFVPDRQAGAQVDINPEILAFLIGEKLEIVEGVLVSMCGPDPKSRSQEEEGRKLVKIGTYTYRVVNGAKYRAIRDEEGRREQNREAQQRHRVKIARKSVARPKVPIGDGSTAERKFVKEYGDGNDPDANAIIERLQQ